MISGSSGHALHLPERLGSDNGRNLDLTNTNTTATYWTSPSRSSRRAQTVTRLVRPPVTHDPACRRDWRPGPMESQRHKLERAQWSQRAAVTPPVISCLVIIRRPAGIERSSLILANRPVGGVLGACPFTGLTTECMMAGCFILACDSTTVFATWLPPRPPIATARSSLATTP